MKLWRMGFPGRRMHRQRDPHGGSPELAEDQHVVEEGVHAHGDPVEGHAEFGVLRAPVEAGVDAADAVEDVGEAYDLDIPGAQGHKLLVGGNEAQDLGGEKEGDEGQDRGKSRHRVQGHAHAAVDVVHVPPAPVLADQHGAKHGGPP